MAAQGHYDRRPNARWLGSVRLAIITAVLIFTAGGTAQADSTANAAGAGQGFRDCSDCPEMVVIPPGSFLMGSSAAETAQDLESVPRDAIGMARISTEYEHPQHLVTIGRPFALGKYPVTRGEFAAFVRESGYSTRGEGCFLGALHMYSKPAGAGWQNPGFAQTDRDPAVCISWQDAQAYVAWLNGKLRRLGLISADGVGSYRLPSEAEWEYAARAGTQTARWWGDAIGSGNANCAGCGSRWYWRTSPVGSFRPNPFGLYDMLGNVYQWMSDCWNKSYLGAPGDSKSWTSGDCVKHVVRGGSWLNEPWVLRSAMRSRLEPDTVGNYVGLRVARAPP